MFNSDTNFMKSTISALQPGINASYELGDIPNHTNALYSEIYETCQNVSIIATIQMHTIFNFK